MKVSPIAEIKKGSGKALFCFVSVSGKKDKRVTKEIKREKKQDRER